MEGSANFEAKSGRLFRSMSLGGGQKRTSGDTPAPGETGSSEVNCQKCRGRGDGLVEKRSGATWN